MTLPEIIEDYHQYRKKAPDVWVEECRDCNDLERVIAHAATARNKADKKHPHQYRLQNLILEKFAAILMEEKERIRACTSFQELIDLISTLKIPGIGSVAIYDTAIRIGVSLGLEPTEIYLHAGTKSGAENLLKRRLPKPTINMSELPKEFQNLTCDQIEDILCIYKNDFHGDSKRKGGGCIPPLKRDRIC